MADFQTTAGEALGCAGHMQGRPWPCGGGSGTPAPRRARTHAHGHARARAHKHTRTCAHAQTHLRAHIRTDTYTRARTHTYTHTAPRRARGPHRQELGPLRTRILCLFRSLSARALPAGAPTRVRGRAHRASCLGGSGARSASLCPRSSPAPVCAAIPVRSGAGADRAVEPRRGPAEAPHRADEQDRGGGRRAVGQRLSGAAPAARAARWGSERLSAGHCPPSPFPARLSPGGAARLAPGRVREKRPPEGPCWSRRAGGLFVGGPSRTLPAPTRPLPPPGPLRSETRSTRPSRPSRPSRALRVPVRAPRPAGAHGVR